MSEPHLQLAALDSTAMASWPCLSPRWLRHSHRGHDFHHDMRDITEQFERLAMMVLLILFGGAVSILLHGPAVTPVMRSLDRQSRRDRDTLS